MTARESVPRPLLVVERIAIADQRITAELRIGDSTDRLVLGTEIDGLLEHEHIPARLGLGGSVVRRSIIEMMEQVQQGEHVSLPCDLTTLVRESFDAWPLPLADRPSRREVDPGIVLVERVDRDPLDRHLATIHLAVRGVPAVVEVNATSENHGTRFRFASGVHPWQLATDDADQMLLALVSALQP